MQITIGNSDEIIKQAQAIRKQVFVEEQHIPAALDLDGLDESAHHLLLLDNKNAIATARLHMTPSRHSVMARIAVIKPYRGQGLASKIIPHLIEHARQVGAKSIEIHAHQHLQQYYEKFGFAFVRKVEVVAEHQLIEMHYHIA